MFFPKATILLLVPLAVSGRTSRVRGTRRQAQHWMPHSNDESGSGKSSKSSKKQESSRSGYHDSCSFYDFEGYWEGIDPETGEVEYVQFDCEIGDGYCTVTEFEGISPDCGGGKAIATGKIYKDDFDNCETPEFELDVKCNFDRLSPSPSPSPGQISVYQQEDDSPKKKANKYSQSRDTRRIKDKEDKNKHKNGGGEKEDQR